MRSRAAWHGLIAINSVFLNGFIIIIIIIINIIIIIIIICVCLLSQIYF